MIKKILSLFFLIKEDAKYFTIRIIFIKFTFKKKILCNNSSYEKKLDRIFSIYENQKYKRITILGIKINSTKLDNFNKIIKNIPSKYTEIIKRFDSKLDSINKNILDLQKYIECLEIVRKIHKESFLEYKEIYTNKDIVLVGNGPTANQYKKIENAIHIGVNRAFYLKDINLDYLFIHDGQKRELLDEAELYNPDTCTKFFGYIDRRFHSYMPVSIPNKYYKNKKMYVVNSQYFLFDNLVYDITSYPLGEYGSVIFSALQFAFWTNPKRIFLVGCDTANNGHFYSNANNGKLLFQFLLKGWNRAKEFKSVFYPDTEIISINPVGLKGLFKDIYIKDNKYFDEHNNIFEI